MQIRGFNCFLTPPVAMLNIEILNCGVWRRVTSKVINEYEISQKQISNCHDLEKMSQINQHLIRLIYVLKAFLGLFRMVK